MMTARGRRFGGPSAASLGLAAALGCLSSAVSAAEPSWRFGAAADYGFDTNVNNAEASADVHDSSFATAEFSVDYTHDFGDKLSAQLRGVLAGQDYFRFNKISSGKGTGMLRLVYRPSGGFYAPELSAWGAAAYWRFGSYIRTSREFRYGLGAVENLTTDIDLRLDLAGSRRIANTQVFTLDSRSVALGFDWSLSRPLTAYGGYQFSYGQIESTGAPTGKIVGAAEAIESDDAFGGVGAGQFAYRLKAHTRVASLGLNYVLSRHLAIDAQGQYIEAGARLGNRYSRYLADVGLLLRF